MFCCFYSTRCFKWIPALYTTVLMSKKPLLLVRALYRSKETFPVAGQCYTCVFTALVSSPRQVVSRTAAFTLLLALGEKSSSACEWPAQAGKGINHGPALTQARPVMRFRLSWHCAWESIPLPLRFIFPSHTHLLHEPPWLTFSGGFLSACDSHAHFALSGNKFLKWISLSLSLSLF